MATAPAPRLSRDQLIIKLATEDGVTDQGEIAKRIAAMGYEKIGAERVGQILRASSGRDKVVRFLEEHPDDTFTSVEISTWTKLDVNKVNYVIDGLQKKGVVTYKVGQAANNHRTLVNIVLTKRARARVAERVATAIVKDKKVDHAKLTVVKDVRLEEVSVTQEEMPWPAPVVVDSVQDASDGHHADIVQVVDELPESTPEGTPESTPKSASDSTDMDIIDFLKYPLIARLLDRERDLNEAAKLLDRHGLDDLELAVLSKMDEYSPLEREVLAYVQAHLRACHQR